MKGTPMSGRLRAVMRNFATGVCVASTYRDEGSLRKHDAITINSLTSVSLDPALISICLQNGSNFLADLLATGKFALSILEGDEDVTAARLAKSRPTRTPAVAALAASPGAHSGALILEEHASIECELWDSFDVGDHKMVIGRVLSINLTAQERPPLAFPARPLSLLADAQRSNRKARARHRARGASPDRSIRTGDARRRIQRSKPG